MSQRDSYKKEAAERAVELVQSGMVVGLGTGETATYAIRRIGALLRAGTLEDVEGVATSLATAAEAVRWGIPLLEESRATPTDITIDGADEIDPALNLIKGRGGALLREKIVAQTSRRVVIVADHSKLSPVLGTRSALPVEVVLPVVFLVGPAEDRCAWLRASAWPARVASPGARLRASA